MEVRHKGILVASTEGGRMKPIAKEGAMTTEREIIAEMTAVLEAAKRHFVEQLMGVENQLYVLGKLVEKLDGAVAAATEREMEAQRELEPEDEPDDPLWRMGLSSGLSPEPSRAIPDDADELAGDPTRV